jgi:hypothetical protein
MSLETFKMVYLSASAAGALAAFWLLRKNRDDLLALSLMSFILLVGLLSFYFDLKKGNAHYGEMMEYLLHGFIEIEADFALTIGTSLVWGTVPFAVAIWLNKKKNRLLLVWTFFIALAALKTLFDGNFLVYQYPELFAHSLKWPIVLFDWAVIYSLAALFVTKGLESLYEKENNDQPPH